MNVFASPLHTCTIKLKLITCPLCQSKPVEQRHNINLEIWKVWQCCSHYYDYIATQYSQYEGDLLTAELMAETGKQCTVRSWVAEK